MSNIFSGIARFRGTANKTPPASQNNRSPISTGAPSPINPPQGGQSAFFPPRVPPLPNSPSLAQTIGMDESSGGMASGDEILNSYHLPFPKQLWLHPGYAKHITKGNFVALSARPITVELGEWIAHQIVEHSRVLWNFVKVIHEKEANGFSICNPTTCPKTSAGPNHTFTWLNSRLEPVEVPAYEYMTLMQRWITGKTDDTAIFPTDPAGVSFAPNPSTATASLSQLASPGEIEWIGKRSGFPRNFPEICRTIFRQMLRVYSHLYWDHYEEPFYHLSLERQLNSSFCHFVLTATSLDFLNKQELEPIQPLVDLWAATGNLPPDSKAYEYAQVRAGERLVQLASAS